MEGHTVRTFDADILNLRIQVLAMGGLAIDQVQRAVQVLTGGDDEAARGVIARHAEIMAAARAIEEEIIGVIARRQPVASDLRGILMIGRIATDLERVGNAARKIARLALELEQARAGLPPRFYNDVRKMSRLALVMLREALYCFDRIDLERAEAVVRRDAEVDSEFQLALRELVTYVMEDQRHLASTIEIVFVLKALERVGDHARNIAAAVPRFGRREEVAASPPPASRAGAEVGSDPHALG